MYKSIMLFVIACNWWIVVADMNALRSYFDYVDRNHDRLLVPHEIREFACTILDSCEPQSLHFKLQIQQMFGEIDVDKSGAIEWDEFVNLLHDGSPIENGIQQVHLALTTDPSTVVVMWISKQLEPNSTIVNYGLSSNNYAHVAVGTHYTYNAGVLGWSGWIHKAILTGLSPSTTYYYQCGDKVYWSDEFSFTTAPDPSKSFNEKHVVAVMGDMGTTIPMGWAVTRQMIDDNQQQSFGFILHAGDVCYAGTGSTWEFEEIWDIWGDQVQGLAANTPYMFAVGNHEHYYNYTSYRARFEMPGEASGGEGNFWWSMDYGNCHYTFMSTEHDYSPSSPQYKWLVQDLAKAQANKKVTPWLIVSGHRPMYCSDTVEWTSHRPGAGFQKTIEPLFETYGVDLYLCGHMHMYERIYPVVNGTVKASGNLYRNPGATAHVVQGTAGVFTDSDYVNPQPAWSANRDNKFGYGRMTIFNSTHLHYGYMHQMDGATLDEFWIVKE